MTVPFVVIATLILVVIGARNVNDPASKKSGQALPAVSAAAPPNAAAQAASCAKLLAKLPVSLAKLAPRVVHTSSAYNFVVAWGDPAILLSCGVDKPKTLYPGSSEPFVTGGDLAGPYFAVTRVGDANVYTTVDRGPYIALRVPRSYPAADYLALISRAINAALPKVCIGATAPGVDPDKLCTRRTK